MSTCIILPTYNEAGSIGELVARTKAVDKGFRILVVDGGSDDGTMEIARKAGAEVMEFGKRGKALAVKEAFANIDDDIAVLLDSDKSYMPEDIPTLLKALEGCDVVVGSRFLGSIEPGAMSALNRFGNKALTFMANALHGRRITDICSGFWAFRRRAYRGMNVDSTHFDLEANFYVSCVKSGISILEVPVRYRKREGKTKLSPIDGLSIGWYLVLKRFSRAKMPMR